MSCINEILICKYDGCNKYYLRPIILPCGKNICQCHIQEILKKNRSSLFDCKFCKSNHEIPENGFILNEDLCKILDLNLHLNEKHKTAKELCFKFDLMIDKYELARKDPENFIYDYVSNVRNKIDLERDRLINEIQKISQEMLNELIIFEKECKSHLCKVLPDLKKGLNINFENIKQQSFNWKNELRKPQIKDFRLEELETAINSTLSKYEDEINDFKNNLLIGKGCMFEAKKLQFSNDHFGKFLIDESINFKHHYQTSSRGMLSSKILSDSQSNDLFKLCEFDTSINKFQLIYRASQDGFDAADFHRKCNGKNKTLTIIKVKGNLNIFGGYTDAAWGKTNNNYENDSKAFIFSLINSSNQSFKSNTINPRYAIYSDPEFGPTFGGGHDIYISSNSNVNNSSSSNFGHSFSHTNYQYNSAQAQSILAGSRNFSTSEIEVYQIF